MTTDKPRRKFKGRETIQKIAERVEECGRLRRTIGVVVEKNRPIFEGKENDERGPAQVDVVILRGHNKLSFTAEEAKRLVQILEDSLPDAAGAERACQEEREAWRRERSVRYEPGPGRGVMSPGKTKRTRDKRTRKSANG